MYIGVIKLFYCFLVRYIQTSQTVVTANPLLATNSINPSQHNSIMENDSNNNNNNVSDSEILLPLPAPSDSSEPVRHITLGETLKLDELGPIIINTGEYIDLISRPHIKQVDYYYV
jgi:hypothetical protein